MNPTPAWSMPFMPGSLKTLEPCEPLDVITPEWAWGDSSGKGVRVAVIDSGVSASHPAIGGRVSGYVSVDEGPGGITLTTTPHEDVYGHGTACAGIIRRVAPDCELYSVRVLGPDSTGKGDPFVAGLRWAIDNGMNVCNLSLGTGLKDYYGPLHKLADLACFHNVLLVAAADNMPVPSFPANFSSVISVAACEDKDPYVLYYNPAPPMEFGAPGIDVEVAWLNGATIKATGNSFSAAHITGLIAKILGKHRHLSLFQVKVILRGLAANMQRTGSASAQTPVAHA